MDKTALVTGGAGFIGSHLVETLLADGWRVVAYDNFNDFYDPRVKRANLAGVIDNPAFELVEGDIRDDETLDACFAAYSPSVVLHLAAGAGVRMSVEQPAFYSDVNCTGTTHVLDAVHKHGADQLVFGSSSSVYGATAQVPFREDDRADSPISPYAAGKRAGELFCHTHQYLYGTKITCLRFFTVYGPRQRPDLAIHKFTRLIDAGDEISVYGDGSAQRDFTYISDIIQGITRAIDVQFDFEVFNLGECRTISVLDLIKLLESAIGKDARIKFMPPQPGDVPITYADISKAEKMLGYKPTTPIEQGIEKFVDWFNSTKHLFA